MKRQLTPGKGKILYALFADMKAAYDMVERNVMIRMMNKIKIRPEIVRAVREKTYKIQLGMKKVRRFWT